jgi:glycosyltransferase involved in cell wall biosynthesis
MTAMSNVVLKKHFKLFVNDIVSSDLLTQPQRIPMFLTVLQLFTAELAENHSAFLYATLKRALRVSDHNHLGILLLCLLQTYKSSPLWSHKDIAVLVRTTLIKKVTSVSAYTKLHPFWDLFDDTEFKPVFRKTQTSLLTTCFPIKLRKNPRLIPNKICIVLREFDANMSYGAHFEVLKNVSLALMLGRETQVHFLFINPLPSKHQPLVTDPNVNQKTYLFNQQLIPEHLPQRTNETIYASNQLINLKIIDSDQVHHLVGFDPNLLKNFIVQQGFESGIFFGGVLDCKTERAIFKSLGLAVILIIMNKNNKLDNFFDLLLSACHHDTDAVVQRFFYPVARQLVIDWQFPSRSYEKCQRLVTVLAHGRIEKGLKNLPADYCAALLNSLEQQQVEWYLIGIEQPEQIPADIRAKPWIKLVSRENDLQSFYRSCDLFLQIPGADGGGTAALKAAINGLPVIALQNTDPAAYLPDAQGLIDADHVFEQLQALLTDSSLRQAVATAQLTYIEKTLTINHAAQNFRDIEARLHQRQPVMLN